MPADTSLSSCARASSAAESRFRINAPVESRNAWVIALDEPATEVLRSVASREWAAARFLVCEIGADGGRVTGGDFVLRGIDDASAVLGGELGGAHVVVMVATRDSGADCAYAIGKACCEQAVMTAGVVLGGGCHEATMAALRPHARVLLSSSDATDLVELLTAFRA